MATAAKPTIPSAPPDGSPPALPAKSRPGDAAPPGAPAPGTANELALPSPSEPRAESRDPGLLPLTRAILPFSLGDLGFEIPWQQRLSTKLYAMIAAVALGTVGAFFYAEVLVQRHLLSQVVEESDLLCGKRELVSLVDPTVGDCDHT